MKNKTGRIIVFWFICLNLVIPTSIALANSGPPPTDIYFRFFSADKEAPKVEGVQFVGCYERSCTSPVNLVQYGKLNSPGFLSTTPAESEHWHFDCTASRCLLQVLSYELKHYPYLRLITSYDEKVQFSEVVQVPDCDYCTVAWKVNLGEPVPLITEDEEFKSGGSMINFLLTYSLTITVEILVAFLLLRFFHKSISLPTKKVLLSVLLVNLLSYPVSWLVIPSFGQFQADSYRKTSLLLAGIVAAITVISIIVQKNRGKIKKWGYISLGISVPICAIMFLIVSLMVSYGNRSVHINGLPWGIVVLLAEIFAVVFESSILSLLFKGEVKYKKALLFSLIANSASFLLGFDLFNMI